jgi:cell division protein FtsI (penicillin-binding protein 3)
LERFEADHGCAVLMEVETGAIKGIANLGRTEEGTYFEKRNYAIWESTEPGSTFKLASVLALLEDGLADTSDLVDTENGVFTIYGKKIRDSNNKGYGTISLKKAFEKSSNVGIAKLVYEHYADDPQRFVDRLYTIGLDRRLELPIRGEGRPVIPTPGQASWSGISLPWMSFGYQVSFTPMQVLSFYNAIANDGVMVKPRLVEEIRQHGRSVEKREPVIINPAICSKETILKLQNLLLGAVEKGTATNIRNPLVQIAGKTGTCQLNYWIKETSDYQASFAGYFPAEDPKYSCIVVINKPNFHRGYYGSTVAAPVFAAIAKSIYRKIPQPVNLEPVNLTALTAEKSWQKQIHNQQLLPNLKGLSGAEVISELENAGHKVRVKGNGLVKWQYPSAGTPLTNNRIIELQLG